MQKVKHLYVGCECKPQCVIIETLKRTWHHFKVREMHLPMNRQYNAQL